MMEPGVDESAALPLPWLAAPLAQALAMRSSHALLVHGAPGAGQFEFALLLAQAWLCEAGDLPGARPCGRCASCRMVRRRNHPDLRLVIPDQLAIALEWATAEDLKLKSDAKPSKDIRVEQVRQAIDWSHGTAVQGHGKALLLHPAESMNHVAASALLKTLEEPAGGQRIVLTADDPQRLLPTVRSRCQRLRLALPEPAAASAWLTTQAGVAAADAPVLLALAAGSPLLAREMAAEGFSADTVAALPLQVAAGDPAGLMSRPLPRVVDLLLKIAHDAACVAAGAAPHYLPAGAVPPGADLARLNAWQRSLLRAARHDEHPWNAGLLVEALVTEAAAVWARPRRTGGGSARASIHSAA
jgi:DNA polymerase-3 subunit delta'